MTQQQRVEISSGIHELKRVNKRMKSLLTADTAKIKKSEFIYEAHELHNALRDALFALSRGGIR